MGDLWWTKCHRDRYSPDVVSPLLCDHSFMFHRHFVFVAFDIALIACVRNDRGRQRALERRKVHTKFSRKTESKKGDSVKVSQICRLVVYWLQNLISP
jgi:hypothetical protein